jgi:hypothetical protein
MSDPDEPADPVRDDEAAEAAVERGATVHREWSTDDPLLVPVVTAVAAVTDTEPTSLPPLYDAIDMGNVERLLRSAPDAAGPGLSVTFRFAGCAVRVTRAGEVTVESSSTASADARHVDGSDPAGSAR